MPPLVRLTLFKIPDQEAIHQATQLFTTLSQDALKDNKPYIQLSAGHTTHADPRSQGYTFVARTVFRSKEDMAFYDEECEAHGRIKAVLRGKVEGGAPVVVVMDG